MHDRAEIPQFLKFIDPDLGLDMEYMMNDTKVLFKQ